MGREVRYVKAGWEHPKDENGSHIPLVDGKDFKVDLKDWHLDKQIYNPEEHNGESFEEYYGKEPDPERYMPAWEAEELTHIQMYETTSEGTPISPVFKIGEEEEMAQWLEDNKASAFGGATASKESWLKMIKAGSSFSAAIINGEVVSGVEALL